MNHDPHSQDHPSSDNFASSHSLRTTRIGRTLTRTSSLVLIGGLATGGAFAAVTGISAAAPTSSAPSTSAPTPGLGRHGHGPKAGLDGGRRGHGSGGTITAIKGTTLTLRTENGTEAVDTSSSTTYTREMQTVGFAALKVGDIVHVAALPSTSGGSNGTTPPSPGTGTINASRVNIVQPRFVGRVASIDNGTYQLVGRDGRLFTVSTTSATRYYNGRSQAGASAVSVGSRVMAEGAKSSSTQMTA
ncbi:MAG: DUF5666 domain-containing protein, partial [Acidimicrobiales bacterium]